VLHEVINLKLLQMRIRQVKDFVEDDAHLPLLVEGGIDILTNHEMTRLDERAIDQLIGRLVIFCGESPVAKVTPLIVAILTQGFMEPSAMK
jgi:hypothetical protein